MATLPDLSTAAISTLCYFDSGAVIKKSDILSLFESFTEYDNGVDGIMSFSHDGARVSTGTRVKVQVRIRTDGMVYAWGLRADEDTAGAAKDSRNGTINWQRALLPIGAYGTSPAAQDTLLFRAIQAVVAADTTAGKITPTAQTVSYYDFQFTSTGSIYVFGVQTAGSVTFQFTQPAGLTIFVFASRLSTSVAPSSGSHTNSVSVNGTTLTNANFGPGPANSVFWSSRQGSVITNLLLPVGTQNNATVSSTLSGPGTGQVAGVLVVYATA